MITLNEAQNKFLEQIKSTYGLFERRYPRVFEDWTIEEVDNMAEFAKTVHERYVSAKIIYIRTKELGGVGSASLEYRKAAYKKLKKLNSELKECVTFSDFGEDYTPVILDQFQKKVIIFMDQLEKMNCERDDLSALNDLVWEIEELLTDLSKIATKPENALNALSGYEQIRKFESIYKSQFPTGVPNMVAEWLQNGHFLSSCTTLGILDKHDIDIVFMSRKRNPYNRFEDAILFNKPGNLIRENEIGLIDFYLDWDRILYVVNTSERITIIADLDSAPSKFENDFVEFASDLAAGVDRNEAVETFLNKYSQQAKGE